MKIKFNLNIDCNRIHKVQYFGKNLIIVRTTEYASIWNLATRKCIKTIKCFAKHLGKNHFLGYSEEEDSIAKIWNYQPGIPKGSLKIRNDVDDIRPLTGKYLATIYPNRIEIWDYLMTCCIRVINQSSNDNPEPAFTCLDEKHFAIGNGGFANIYNWETGQCIRKLYLNQSIGCFFYIGGTYLACTCGELIVDTEIKILDWKSGITIMTTDELPLPGENGTITSFTNYLPLEGHGFAYYNCLGGREIFMYSLKNGQLGQYNNKLQIDRNVHSVLFADTKTCYLGLDNGEIWKYDFQSKVAKNIMHTSSHHSIKGIVHLGKNFACYDNKKVTIFSD